MSKIILGLDPASYKNMGVCIAKISQGKMDIIERYTKIFNVTKETKDTRFEDVFCTIEKIIKKYNIDAICFERTQFGKPFVLSQIYETIGVIKLSAQRYNVDLLEISPKTAKKQITGNGNSKKKEMMEEVANKFNFNKNSLSSDHEADAVAMCYTYSIMNK